MILNKKDYKEYLEADRKANKKGRKRPRVFGDYTWKYLRCLRKLEYYKNVKTNYFMKLDECITKIRFSRLRLNTGIQIPENVFGKGLGLFHFGSIIVNSSARFGDYCVIQSDTNVSANVCGGDMIYLAPGAKILEGVSLGNSVIVGANAVVTKSVDESGITLVGIPAKKISNRGFVYQK